MEVTIIKGPLFEKIEKDVYKKIGKIILNQVNEDQTKSKKEEVQCLA